jgi:hypothetical protein
MHEEFRQGKRTMPIAGIEGLSVDALRKEVDAGARFVVFTWVISLLVVTFRRSSDIQFVRAQESAAVKSLPYTLLSAAVGWWGFPWGFIYTPMAIFQNLSGGQDVTAQVMGNIDSAWSKPTLDENTGSGS